MARCELALAGSARTCQCAGHARGVDCAQTAFLQESMVADPFHPRGRSEVCLHSLARGQSSSCKLRRTLLCIDSPLLASGSHRARSPPPSRRPVHKRQGTCRRMLARGKKGRAELGTLQSLTAEQDEATLQQGGGAILKFPARGKSYSTGQST